MDFVKDVHSYLRLIILVLGALGVLRSLVSLGTARATFMRIDESLGRGYSLALDAQTLAGALLAVGLLGQAGAVTWIHPIIMLPAVVVSHAGRRFRSRPDRDRHKAQLAIYAVSLVLIAVGLAVIGELKLR